MVYLHPYTFEALEDYPLHSRNSVRDWVDTTTCPWVSAMSLYTHKLTPLLRFYAMRLSTLCPRFKGQPMRWQTQAHDSVDMACRPVGEDHVHAHMFVSLAHVNATLGPRSHPPADPIRSPGAAHPSAAQPNPPLGDGWKDRRKTVRTRRPTPPGTESA